MVYEVKVYLKKHLKAVAAIKCDEEYLKDLKDDLQNDDLFLDLENIIVIKNDIKKIVIKEIK